MHCTLSNLIDHWFLKIEIRNTVRAKCRKILNKYAQDSKMNVTMVGLKSCSVSCNCLGCIRPKSAKDYPVWVKTHAETEMGDWDAEKFGPNPLLEAAYKDYPTRCGNWKQCADLFDKKVSKNKELVSTAIKPQQQREIEKLTHSVSNQPLRNPKDKFALPPDALHIVQGMINHENKTTINLIRTRIGNAPEAVSASAGILETALRRSQEMIKAIEQSPRYKEAKKSHKVEGKIISEIETKLKDPSTNHGTLNKNLLTMESKIEGTLYGTLGIAHRTVRGLKIFQQVLKDGRGKLPASEVAEKLIFQESCLSIIFTNNILFYWWPCVCLQGRTTTT